MESDILVLATAYDNLWTTFRKAVGDRVADRCNDVYHLDEEGEISTVNLTRLKPMLKIKLTTMNRCGDPRDTQAVAHGWQSGTMPHLLKVSDVTDQGRGKRSNNKLRKESHRQRHISTQIERCIIPPRVKLIPPSSSAPRTRRMISSLR